MFLNGNHGKLTGFLNFVEVWPPPFETEIIKKDCMFKTFFGCKHQKLSSFHRFFMFQHILKQDIAQEAPERRARRAQRAE